MKKSFSLLCFLLSCFVFFSAQAQERVLTPEITEGPFYPHALSQNTNVLSDLTHDYASRVAEDGHFVVFEGRVVDQAGNPLRNTKVELWQTDGTSGRYYTELNEQTRDPNFSYFGRTYSDENGAFVFVTVRPIEYEVPQQEGRPEWIRPDHLHWKFFIDQNRQNPRAPANFVHALDTQTYFHDDRDLIDVDHLLLSLSEAQRESVIGTFERDESLSNAQRDVRRGSLTFVLSTEAKE